MKRFLLSIITFVSLSIVAGASGTEGIVPAPSKIEQAKGHFRVGGTAFKCDPALDPRVKKAVQQFALQISIASGKTCSVSFPLGLAAACNNENFKGVVLLVDNTLPAESYFLKVETGRVIVKASDCNGFLYAMQTIRQMLPDLIYTRKQDDNLKWVIPCCTIEDSPRFSYRGCHLDCSRHFWEVSDVKKYLDVMAMFKMNSFHWHLTDDQGWRIEIKAYPLLAQKGGFRSGTMIGHDENSDDNERYGGYYTQEQIKEVVDYAWSLGITVIPEIDLPGHMLAALSAYPWLGCTGGPYEVWHKWGVAEQVLCPGKESTFTFLETVLSEVADLFPGEYIHIGGDECPKNEWKNCPDCQALIANLGIKGDAHFSSEQYLQSYVTARMQKFLSGKGKKIIGWDEILEGNLEAGATVMSWRGTAGGQEAATKGFDAIMCPSSHCYLNFCQGEDADAEPIAFNSYLPIETVYSFDPLEGIPSEMQKHIIGVQCNMWSEYIDNSKLLEYMLLPRLLAIAEVQWCIPENRNWERFRQAVVGHEFSVLRNAGYTYSRVIEGIYGGQLFEQ